MNRTILSVVLLALGLIAAACGNDQLTAASSETLTQGDSETEETTTTSVESSSSDFLLLGDLVRLEDESESRFPQVTLDLLDGEPFSSDPARSDFRAHTLNIIELPFSSDLSDTNPNRWFKLTSEGWIEATRSNGEQDVFRDCGSVVFGEVIQDQQTGWITFTENGKPQDADEEVPAVGCDHELVELNSERLFSNDFRLVLEADGSVTLQTADDQAQFRVFAERDDFIAALERETLEPAN